MRIIFGIDPGLSGAIALFKLNEIGGIEAAGVKDMPIISNPYGKGNVIDLFTLSAILKPQRAFDVAAVFIEVVASMPNQGIASAFKFGGVSMAPEAMAVAFGYRVIKIKPSEWKKEAKLINKEKDASLSLARGLFPQLSHCLGRPKDDGRAEALLIGMVGHKLHGGIL